jgi:hypothetical protein
MGVWTDSAVAPPPGWEVPVSGGCAARGVNGGRDGEL